MIKNGLNVNIGKDLALKLWDRNNHCLVSGNKGSFFNFIKSIENGVAEYSKNELELYIGSFSFDNKDIDASKIINMMTTINAILQKRGVLFKNAELHNIKSYNEKSGDNLPYILLILDYPKYENNKDNLTILNHLEMLLRTGRSFGIHCIVLADNETDVESVIKSNLPIRIDLLDNLEGTIAYNYNDDKEKFSLLNN